MCELCVLCKVTMKITYKTILLVAISVSTEHSSHLHQNRIGIGSVETVLHIVILSF